MAEFPERIQNKILAYTVILASRFPPSINYYRISTGYVSSTDALNDPKSSTIIYTIDNSEPVSSGIIYIDQLKNDIFRGGALFYHLFDSTEASLTKAIQINNKGVVLKIATSKDGSGDPTPPAGEL